MGVEEVVMVEGVAIVGTGRGVAHRIIVIMAGTATLLTRRRMLEQRVMHLALMLGILGLLEMQETAVMEGAVDVVDAADVVDAVDDVVNVGRLDGPERVTEMTNYYSM